ncbi:MAG: transglycosylase SLT domain-containing protein [Bdellovibrio sp.]
MKTLITKTIITAAFLSTIYSQASLAMGSRLPKTDSSSNSSSNSNSGSNNSSVEQHLRDVTPLWDDKVADGKDWTVHVNAELDRLGKNLLDVVPADKTLFCPKYGQLSYDQRKQYWAFIISAMARFESNFKTDSTYKESFRDSHGNRVVSRGLLQISIESGNSYGCGFKDAQELHDPKKNLSCGIRILDRWLDRDGRIAGKVGGSWKGGARYWAVLRSTNKSSYNSILGWSQNLSICK